MHVPEKAISLYERAGQMRPNEAQWPLAVASSTQRVGNYHKALQILKNTRSKFPENVECNVYLLSFFAFSYQKLSNNGSRFEGFDPALH